MSPTSQHLYGGRSWKGDWAKLEYKHGFIQWLYVGPIHTMLSVSRLFPRALGFPYASME